MVLISLVLMRDALSAAQVLFFWKHPVGTGRFTLELLFDTHAGQRVRPEMERRAEAGGHQSILLWNLNLIEHAIHPLANYDIDENDSSNWMTPSKRLCARYQL
ncbi:hypothetical protein EDD22DRAFT_387673 [Suillus occidentalis]|nr:hypothetical protein EDD22DRAFT_387673 [Suillus occidentalis]